MLQLCLQNSMMLGMQVVCVCRSPSCWRCNSPVFAEFHDAGDACCLCLQNSIVLGVQLTCVCRSPLCWGQSSCQARSRSCVPSPASIQTTQQHQKKQLIYLMPSVNNCLCSNRRSGISKGIAMVFPKSQEHVFSVAEDTEKCSYWLASMVPDLRHHAEYLLRG